MMCTSGTVTDAGGRVINDVKITITNIATGVTRKVTTNDEGFYSAPRLLPGTCGLKLSAPGFRTEARGGIEVAVGASVALDQALRVGSNLETVVVQPEIPAVPLSTSDIRGVVNATTVRELPLNGRSWTDLAHLQPVTSPDFSLYKNNFINVDDSTGDSVCRTSDLLVTERDPDVFADELARRSRRSAGP